MNGDRSTSFFIRYALFLLLISAGFGVLLRLHLWRPISQLPYLNLIQGHSHVAFLGWGYLAAILVIRRLFLKENQPRRPLYKPMLYIIIVTVSAMLVSFPLYGYKVFSIALLTLFRISSFILSIGFLKDVKGHSADVYFIHYWLYCYLHSSLATWCLPYVVINYGKEALYYNIVYAYLHFLYNGFFVFILFGCLFKLFEKSLADVPEKTQRSFFYFLAIACVPAYALSVLWSTDQRVYYVTGGIAACLQTVALYALYRISKVVIRTLKPRSLSHGLYGFFITAYVIKTIAKLLSAFPYVAKQTTALKPFIIIGYLHLFTLAFMTVYLLFLLYRTALIRLSMLGKSGLLLLIIGILVTEFTLFGRGLLVVLQVPAFENHPVVLVQFSLLMLIGTALIFLDQFRNRF